MKTQLKLDYTVNGVRVFDRPVTRITTEPVFNEFVVELSDRQGVTGKAASFELALSEYLDNLSAKIGVVSDANLHP